jgi:hypothetical protein
MSRFTVEDIEAAIRGGAPLRFFGKSFVKKLRSDDRARFERAKAVGFLVVPLGADDALSNAWRALCEVARTPLVILTERARHASLVVDVSPTGEWFNDTALKRLSNGFGEVGGEEHDDWFVGGNRAEHVRVPLQCGARLATAAHANATSHRETYRVAQARIRRTRSSYH